MLYKAEHWKITVNNNSRSHWPCFLLNSKPVWEGLTGLEGQLKHIKHLRHFELLIAPLHHDNLEGRLNGLRENLYCAYDFLRKVPSIQFMHLVLKYSPLSRNWSDGTWDEAIVAHTLGQLRNVKSVVVESGYRTPPALFETMKTKMQGSGSAGVLLPMYLELKAFASHCNIPKKMVDLARKAMQQDDAKKFMEARAAIVASVREWLTNEVRKQAAETAKYESTMKKHGANINAYLVGMERYFGDSKNGNEDVQMTGSEE